jgi:hypothetical protein
MPSRCPSFFRKAIEGQVALGQVTTNYEDLLCSLNNCKQCSHPPPGAKEDKQSYNATWSAKGYGNIFEKRSGKQKTNPYFGTR